MDKKRIAVIIFLFIVSLQLAYAASNVALSDQGAGVTSKTNGNRLSNGSLRVEIFTAVSGGNLIYNQTFANAIQNGTWGVMLGENPLYLLPLDYGKVYYKDYKINGTDVDFLDYNGNTVERQIFYSPLGEINGQHINETWVNATIKTVGAVFNVTGSITALNSSFSRKANISHTHTFANITGNQNMSNKGNITNVNTLHIGNKSVNSNIPLTVFKESSNAGRTTLSNFSLSDPTTGWIGNLYFQIGANNLRGVRIGTRESGTGGFATTPQYIDFALNTFDIINTGAYPIRFYTTNLQRMKIDSSGNVNINNPASTLTVNGSAAIKKNLNMSNVGNITNINTIKATTIYSNGKLILTTSDNTSTIHTHTFANITGNQNMSNKGNITNVNRIGIGNSGTTGLLTVFGAATGSHVTMANVGGNNAGLYGFSATPTHIFSLTRQESPSVGSVALTAYGSVGLKGGQTTTPAGITVYDLLATGSEVRISKRLNMSNVGNITNVNRLGIGTKAPFNALHVSQGTSPTAITVANAQNGLTLTATNNGLNRIYFENLASTTGQRVFFIDNSAGIMSISSVSDAGTSFVKQNIFTAKYDGSVSIAKSLNMSNVGNITNVDKIYANNVTSAYYAKDGTKGFTGTCAAGTTLTVKNGLITGCS